FLPYRAHSETLMSVLECGPLSPEELTELLPHSENRPFCDALSEMRAIKGRLARLIGRPSAPFRGLIGMAFTLDPSTPSAVKGHVLLPGNGLRIWAMLDVRNGCQRVLLSELEPQFQHGRIFALAPMGSTWDVLLDAPDSQIRVDCPWAITEDEW